MNEDRAVLRKPVARIAGAKAMAGRAAEIVWQGGDRQTIDLLPALASHRSFVKLREDDELFRTMRVGEYGSCLEWADGAQLSADWIGELADANLDNSEFRDAMDTLRMTLDGMAARLGVARRLIAAYRKDKPIPKHIALATRYLLDQHRAG